MAYLLLRTSADHPREVDQIIPAGESSVNLHLNGSFSDPTVSSVPSTIPAANPRFQAVDPCRGRLALNHVEAKTAAKTKSHGRNRGSLKIDLG
jgi:hypothetical protein